MSRPINLRDLLNEASLDMLLAWSAEPGLLPRVPSGPDRGKSWDRLGDDALKAFARDRDIDVRFSAGVELAKRGETGLPAVSEPAQRTLF